MASSVFSYLSSNLYAPIEAGETAEERKRFVQIGKHLESFIGTFATFVVEHAFCRYNGAIRPLAVVCGGSFSAFYSSI